jgi:hypothetical protein
VLAHAGLDDVRESTVENPMTTTEDKLFLAELIDNMRGAMLAGTAATAPELDALRDEVESAARDPSRVVYQARIHQVCGAATRLTRGAQGLRSPPARSDDRRIATPADNRDRC